MKWLWYFYFYVFFTFAVFSVLEFFKADAAIHIYYRFLTAYHFSFLIPYFLNLLAIIATLISLEPLHAYIAGRPTSFSPDFCRWLLMVRAGLDLGGRSYSVKTLQAIYYHDPLVMWIVVGFMFLLIAPSYWAQARYTFRWEKNH